MTSHHIAHPEARLEPVSDADYNTYRGRHREPAECPCCGAPTELGWIIDQGCCYTCSVELDRPVKPEPFDPIEWRNGKMYFRF